MNHKAVLHGIQVRVPALSKRIGALILNWMTMGHECKCDKCQALRKLLRDPPLVDFLLGFSEAVVIQAALMCQRSDLLLGMAWQLSQSLAEGLSHCELPSGLMHNVEQSHAMSRETIRAARIQFWFAREWMHVEPGERLDRLMNEARMIISSGEFPILDENGFQFDSALRARVATLASWIAQQVK